MEFPDSKIMEYCEQHTTPEWPVLRELNRETHLKVMTPQMLAGHYQGTFLRFLSMMIKPKTILEIGTYTGYSAICLATGLQEGGWLDTIDVNEELEEIIKRYLHKAGLSHKVRLHIGNALEIIPSLPGSWDMVYIDADKINYTNYYNLVFDRVTSGGYIIADNVLWSGKVLEEEKDEETSAIDAFNKMVQKDDRVDNILVPVRDGLMIARKIV